MTGVWLAIASFVPNPLQSRLSFVHPVNARVRRWLSSDRSRAGYKAITMAISTANARTPRSTTRNHAAMLFSFTFR